MQLEELDGVVEKWMVLWRIGWSCGELDGVVENWMVLWRIGWSCGELDGVVENYVLCKSTNSMGQGKYL
jgi:hypothetical protein